MSPRPPRKPYSTLYIEEEDIELLLFALEKTYIEKPHLTTEATKARIFKLKRDIQLAKNDIDAQTICYIKPYDSLRNTGGSDTPQIDKKKYWMAVRCDFCDMQKGYVRKRDDGWYICYECDKEGSQ